MEFISTLVDLLADDDELNIVLPILSESST